MKVARACRQLMFFANNKCNTNIYRNKYISNQENVICRKYSTKFERLRSLNLKKRPGLLSLTVSASAAGFLIYKWSKGRLVVTANDGQPPEIKPSRSIKSNSDTTGLKLTLYQYQTCPFCCKARAYLDYYGFSYDVVEVNSVWRTQIKWSNYKKVPILVVHNQGEDGFLQLNDSSVIISILESYLEDRSVGVDKLVTYYPSIETTNKKGKVVKEWPNKYFVMYGEKDIKTSTPEERKSERKWRKWADEHFVHLISPNIYRSREEALQAFRYFDEVGEWEKTFSSLERKVVIYVGATAMYFVGKMLKKKYDLKDDVRLSLYEACNEWTKAIGKKRDFMGGAKPDLSDLAVYGVLNSMQGCTTFQDMLKNTSIGDWYYRMQRAVTNSQGSQAR